ncbi:MAG: ferrous iron transport protein A [Acidobacteria bacterium]|nr:ferrous iron transport protein A [Acidobacteriota bacterium]
MSVAQSIPDIPETSFKEAGESAGRSVSLDRLPHGAHARVFSVGGSGAVARRLMEMGVVPGAPVCVVKCAPLGDPLEVRVRDYHLALRRNEAQMISVVISDKEKP